MMEKKLMTKIKLATKERTAVGQKLRSARAEGHIPAVLYGHKITPQHLWVDLFDFDRVRRAAGESTIIELSPENGVSASVLIQDVQKDPVTGVALHVDFFQVRMDEEIEKSIALVFEGVAPAIKELGGILLKTLDEIAVRCLPAHLPQHISVDLSSLKNFGDHIAIKDLPPLQNVEILVPAETIIVSVAKPRTEEEIAALSEKVEEDVTKVEGVAEKAPTEETPAEETKKE